MIGSVKSERFLIDEERRAEIEGGVFDNREKA